jgi:hypothetical protein
MDTIQKNITPEAKIPEIESYFINKAINISRNELGVPTGGSWETETVTRKSYVPFYEWMSNYRKTDRYREILTHISTSSGLPIENLMQPIERFLIKTTFSDTYVEELESFLDELEGKPPQWIIIAKMTGIIPKKKLVYLKENLLIRQVEKEDLTYTSYISGLGTSHSMRMPHSILELTTRGYPPKIQHELEKIISLLLLYRVAAVRYSSYKLTSNSFLHHSGGTLFSGKFYSNEPILFLSNSDIDNLKEFINTIEPLLHDINIREKPLSFLDISLRRYSDSVTLSMSIEEKYLHAMMGLEALYLDRSIEARFRLSLRVSKTLELLGDDSLEVYSNMLRAYEYRSAYVHGSRISEKHLKNANSMIVSIQDYLRKSLLLWLKLDINSKKKKENFLREIDASMISSGKPSELVSKIDENKKYIPSRAR